MLSCGSVFLNVIAKIVFFKVTKGLNGVATLFYCDLFHLYAMWNFCMVIKNLLRLIREMLVTFAYFCRL